MCVSASGDEMMCRIEPKLHDTALEKTGCRIMEMKGRQYKGYVYINEEGVKSKKDFDYWIALALGFNNTAKYSKTKTL